VARVRPGAGRPIDR